MITLMIVLIAVGLLGLVAMWDKIGEAGSVVLAYIFGGISASYDFVADMFSN